METAQEMTAQNKALSIFQEVDLSFTENLIPVHVPVKQYDNQARKVR